jgi:hypothetical protein
MRSVGMKGVWVALGAMADIPVRSVREFVNIGKMSAREGLVGRKGPMVGGKYSMWGDERITVDLS